MSLDQAFPTHVPPDQGRVDVQRLTVNQARFHAR